VNRDRPRHRRLGARLLFQRRGKKDGGGAEVGRRRPEDGRR
jgi:hypothetical protein